MVGSASFGGSPSHEQWGCVHILRGHASDVLDLSWSPDRKYLASCSVDNTIVIWNAKNLPQKTSVIDGHRGLVKGLAWDPVGKFIASQSDDRSVRIWRTSDWKEAKTITEPFQKCSGTTHVLRLSWSPDGKYIVSAHSLNNEGPTAQIIERGADWKMGMDFVGHRKAVEVVLFNPHLFVKSGSKDNHGCLALGSKDRSLSIWLTNHKRPLLVMHDLFNDSILDLSWSVDGYELLVCSTDGSIAYLSFSSKELGHRLSKQAFDDLYLRTYGFKRAEVKTSDTSMVLIENPEMLKLHCSTPKKSSSLEDSALSKDLNQSTPGLVSTTAKASSITKQVETRTKEGKRRITPITLTTEPRSISHTPLPFTSFSPKQNKSAVVQTTPERDVTTAAASKKSSSGSENSTPKPYAEFAEGSTPPKPISFEPLSPKGIQHDPVASGRPETSGSPSKGTPSKTAKKRGIEDRDQQEEVSVDIPKLPKAKKLRRRGAQLSVGCVSGTQSPKNSTPQKQSSLTILKQGSVVMLPAPKVEPQISIVLMEDVAGQPQDDDADDFPVPAVEVDNNQDTGQFTLSYSAREQQKSWKASLASPCLLAAANSEVTCAACQDRSLSVFSTQTGRLLIARLLLPEVCFELKVESHFALAVLRSAHLSVWDVRSVEALVRNASFSHLLQSAKQGPDECLLTKHGQPVVRVGGNSYIFNTDVESWMELASTREASEVQPPHLGASSSSSVAAGPLPLDSLQKRTRAPGRDDSLGLMLQQAHIGGASSTTSTLAYLESQISRSLCVRSPLEYRSWGKAYVQFLVKNNMEGRLREFCGKFSGPLGSHEGDLVLGFSRGELLAVFLAIIAKNPKLQRLYSEFKGT